MVEGEHSSLFIEQVQVNYCKARKDTSDMSHESTIDTQQIEMIRTTTSIRERQRF